MELNDADCRNSFGNNVIVRANSYNYASSGSFDCSNGGRAFFPNKTLATNTTCLYNATWDQEDNVQCWTGLYRAKIAPNISYVRANEPQSRILIVRMFVVQMLVFCCAKSRWTMHFVSNFHEQK